MKNLATKFLFWGVVLFVVSFFVRAVSLQSVDQVVFDEVHFGKFISSYCCTHQRFFDIHPPIGKLIIAGGAYMSGYAGNFPFESIGQPYGNISIENIRISVAFFGALLPVVIYILLLRTGVSLPFSLVGALAVALDNAFVVESRFILTDSILLTATFAAIAGALASVRSSKELQSWVYLIVAGVCAGVAVGTKFTGLIAGVLVVLIFAWEIVKPLFPLQLPLRRGERLSTLLLKILTVILVAIAIYLLGWMFHFSLLTMPGSGDAWGIPTGYFWEDVLTIHRQMVSANYNLTATHPYGSAWWSWPFMVRSVFYWQGEGNQFIYLLGNPIVWWGSFLLLITACISFCIQIFQGSWKLVSRLFLTGAFIYVIGYAGAYIPLMRVPRVLFLYHYLTPLLFALLIGVWWVDSIIVNRKRIISIVACVGILAGFCFISPLTYGTPLPDYWYDALFSLTSWR